MKFIALFFPAIISMAIRHKRGRGCKGKLFLCLVEYGLTVLLCNLFSMIFITYVIGINGILESAFESFAFFIKYVFIEGITAFILPYCEEVCKKYVHIGFEIEDKRNDKENM